MFDSRSSYSQGFPKNLIQSGPGITKEMSPWSFASEKINQNTLNQRSSKGNRKQLFLSPRLAAAKIDTNIFGSFDGTMSPEEEMSPYKSSRFYAQSYDGCIDTGIFSSSDGILFSPFSSISSELIKSASDANSAINSSAWNLSKISQPTTWRCAFTPSE